MGDITTYYSYIALTEFNIRPREFLEMDIHEKSTIMAFIDDIQDRRKKETNKL